MGDFYRLAVLIPPDHALNFEIFIGRLRDKLASSGFSIQTDGTKLVHLHKASWQYHLSWEDEVYVQSESAEIAEIFGKDDSQKHLIGQCARRISGWGDDDLAMRHFNDYVLVMQAIEDIPGIFIFDPQLGEITNT